MLSIVVCSINESYLHQLKENIDEMIGVEYELLVWDNKGVNKGICEVYNLMAQKARFDLICFLHEDIIFQTINWGQQIERIFNDNPSIGVVGVAGAKYKSARYSGWYSGIREIDCANITHRYSWGDELISLSPSGNSLEEVACVDGVFICARKKIWEALRFDEVNLKGFHFYDLDFSLRAQSITRCMVTYEVMMIHLTKGGDFGDKWVEIAMDFHKRIKDLPRSVLMETVKDIDARITKTWFDVLKHQPISLKNKWSWINGQGLLFKPGYAYSIVKFLVYKSLGLHKIHKRVKKNG